MSNGTTPANRAEERMDRAFQAAVTSLGTIMLGDFLGPWFAWAYMALLFVTALLFAVYAYGFHRGSRV